MEYTFELMEGLLRLEAEVKGLLGATDREQEQELMQELSMILDEAEFLFGPRDRSYELLAPRITECGYAHPYVYPFRKIRIYLTTNSKRERYLASYELSHEAIHVLSPTNSWGTTLEEGLAAYFSLQYLNRVYGLRWESTSHADYDAAMHAVSPLLAKNKFVIKELRERQPLISKIDEKLLIEVTGIEPERAKFLCSDFQIDQLTNVSWSKRAAQRGQLFVNCVRSIWE